ncbi:MAG TPA: hypothetical protein VGS80_11185 [Ktedonobacterales bacterium]|nr:hypothetical protein [Ktedonobacterales bacterium]
MRLAEALRDSSALNRSGTWPIWVLAGVGDEALFPVTSYVAYEVHDADHTRLAVNELLRTTSLEDVQTVLRRYQVDPDAWYPG